MKKLRANLVTMVPVLYPLKCEHCIDTGVPCDGVSPDGCTRCQIRGTDCTLPKASEFVRFDEELRAWDCTICHRQIEEGDSHKDLNTAGRTIVRHIRISHGVGMCKGCGVCSDDEPHECPNNLHYDAETRTLFGKCQKCNTLHDIYYLRHHEESCGEMKSCEYCNAILTYRSHGMHVPYCRENPNRRDKGGICAFCQKYYGDLTQHICLSDERNADKGKCDFCGLRLSVGSLTNHLKVCRSKNPDRKPTFKCDWCDGMFMTQDTLDIHKKNTCSDPNATAPPRPKKAKVKCEWCQADVVDIRYHQRKSCMKRPADIPVCRFCGHAIKNLALHEQKCGKKSANEAVSAESGDSKAKHKCNWCQKSFERLIHHQRNCKKRPAHIPGCQFCDFWFVDIQKHEAQCPKKPTGDDKPKVKAPPKRKLFTCSNCRESFTDEDECLDHEVECLFS